MNASINKGSTLRHLLPFLLIAATTLAQVPENETPVFRGSLNLVFVPVVVTDSESRSRNDLNADSFEVFDQGKRQSITTFSVQVAPSLIAQQAPAKTPDSQANSPQREESYTAFLFDDIHLKADDLIRVRDAADRFLQSKVRSTARIGVFTTSGQTTLGLTDDRGKLREALGRIQARPLGQGQTSCPALSDYEADLIVNKQNDQAFQAAIHQVIFCLHLDPGNQTVAKQKVRNAAAAKLEASETGAKLCFSALEALTRRLAKLPGQRQIVLLSPGFVIPDRMRPEQDQAVDRAIRASVVVNALDARGLYAPSAGGDISKPSYDIVTAKAATEYGRESAAASGGVLSEIAYATGGDLARNSNDLDQGLKSLMIDDRSRYILGFSPQNLKLDGSFHLIKIRLTSKANLHVQARTGYYALPEPTQGQTSERDLEDALFFRTEIHDFPLDLKTEAASGKINVTLHVGIEPLPFKNAAGVRQDDLTVVTGLFDSKRKYIAAKKQVIQLRIPPADLDKALSSGLNLTESFDASPGEYTVRAVAQDGEGDLLSSATADRRPE